MTQDQQAYLRELRGYIDKTRDNIAQATRRIAILRNELSEMSHDRDVLEAALQRRLTELSEWAEQCEEPVYQQRLDIPVEKEARSRRLAHLARPHG